MKRITLKLTAQGWAATFHDDTEVIAAFGTDTIPTAYTANASAETVQSAIAKLNPGHVVTLGA